MPTPSALAARVPARSGPARALALLLGLLGLALLPSAPSRAQPSFERIHDIQSDAHRSPAEDRRVDAIPGIVTLLRSGGFYLQDPEPDARPSTSEAIYVRHAAAGELAVGDAVRVSGTVREERLEEAWLTRTLIDAEAVDRLDRGMVLPPPIVLGEGGRIPPASVIDDDADGDVEQRGRFQATVDGIDFYESLEHMRVQVNEALVVGPSDEGRVVVVGDAGRHASGLELGPADQPTGALALAPTDLEALPISTSPVDFNPERIAVDPIGSNLPRLHLGARLDAPIVGVLDYDEGDFEIQATERLQADAAEPEPAPLPLASPDTLSVASFNLENLSAAEGPERFEAIAGIIVDTLAAPDLLILQEIQDDNGPGDGGLVRATLTLSTLALAIEQAGGPEYRSVNIDPRYNNDGGAILSNIRVVFLYREDRGLRFVSRPGGDATTPVEVQEASPGQPRLSLSPGRIEPTNPAFTTSRKPLAGEFTWQGRPLFVVGVHLVARLSDDPLFGRFQPPRLASEPKRLEQARAIQRFTTRVLTIDPEAWLLVAGDFNDFWFSETLAETAAVPGTAPLSNLMGDRPYRPAESLPPAARYSYVYQGNAQALDHILVSPALARQAAMLEVPHTASHLAPAAQTTDHDPLLARFGAPEAGGPPRPYTVTLPILLHRARWRPEPSPTPSSTPAPLPSPTASPPAMPAPPAPRLSSLSCTGRDEQVALTHPGPAGSRTLPLDGWTLRSTIGDQELALDDQVLQPQETLVVHSGPDAPDSSPGHLLWTRRYIWTDGDVAQLLAPDRRIAAERPCP